MKHCLKAPTAVREETEFSGFRLGPFSLTQFWDKWIQLYANDQDQYKQCEAGWHQEVKTYGKPS